MKLGRYIVVVLLAAVTAAWYGLAIAQSDDESDEQEEVVTLEETPEAVKQTILNELARDLGLAIEREVENGITVYDAEFVRDGKEIEYEIAADGQLLEKEIEEGVEDDDD